MSTNQVAFGITDERDESKFANWPSTGCYPGSGHCPASRYMRSSFDQVARCGHDPPPAFESRNKRPSRPRPASASATAAVPAQRGQMQLRPRSATSIRSSTAGGKSTDEHQHGVRTCRSRPVRSHFPRRTAGTTIRATVTMGSASFGLSRVAARCGLICYRLTCRRLTCRRVTLRGRGSGRW